MAITETARLERETEATRAQLEQTLGELRARMSPGQLLDQASDYLRNGSGRAFLGNLRDEAVRNPVPVALVGAGIAWLAISGAMGKRVNGNGLAQAARDWGETAATAHDLAHGDGPNAAPHARRTAEGWVDDARDAMSEVRDSVREGMDEMRERAGIMYDETAGWARQAGEEWIDEAREGADHIRERATGMYDHTVTRARRAAGKAVEYGRAARHAMAPDGALMNFCREQPMLVAGLGVAFGAALAAMIPASRAENRIMGEASRKVRDRVRDVAAESVRSAAERGEGSAASREPGEPSEERTRPGAAEVERGLEQADARPNVEGEPQSAASYAEAAEAGTPSASEHFGAGEIKDRG